MVSCFGVQQNWKLVYTANLDPNIISIIWEESSQTEFSFFSKTKLISAESCGTFAAQSLCAEMWLQFVCIWKIYLARGVNVIRFVNGNLYLMLLHRMINPICTIYTADGKNQRMLCYIMFCIAPVNIFPIYLSPNTKSAADNKVCRYLKSMQSICSVQCGNT